MDYKIHFLFCYCIYYCGVSVLCERGGEEEGGTDGRKEGGREEGREEEREDRRISMHMVVRGQLSRSQFSPSMIHSEEKIQVIRHV